jgi:hypothetical protein
MFIAFEYVLIGKALPAVGKVQFALRIKEHVVCVVEAKKEDMLQGRAQSLLELAMVREVHPYLILTAISIPHGRLSTGLLQTDLCGSS